MELLLRWSEQWRAGMLARRMQATGQVGFFNYRFAPDRFTWSPGLCALFGLDAAPLGGIEHWYARVCEADRTRLEREVWTACALQRRHATMDYGVGLRGEGARRLSSRVQFSYDAAGRPVRMAGVTVDVSQQHEAALARARDEVMARLGHRVRTPLGALASAAEVLRSVDPGSADAREACAVVGRQVARLAQLLDEASTGVAAPAAPAASRAPENTGPLPLSRRRKVLLVEDNRDALAALQSRLESDGHDVRTAGDGLEGLCTLRVLRPEVSIVDIGLPRLNGLDLARHARAAGYAGRMVALSGRAGSDDRRAARAAGFDAFLVKPVDTGQLRASLATD